MRIAVGSDHAGFELKTKVKAHLGELGHEVVDFGTEGTERTDYPIYAHRVGRAVVDGNVERGIVMCGSGIGVSIAANKVRGVRAALVWDEETARLSRAHNDSNVLALGGRTMDHELSLRLVDIWLETAFDGGRHVRRVEMVEEDPPQRRERSDGDDGS